MNIYQLLTDSNISGTSGDLFLYKILNPGESFEIVMRGKPVTTELIESHLSIIHADEFSKTPLFKDFYQANIEMFNYPFCSIEIDDGHYIESSTDDSK